MQPTMRPLIPTDIAALPDLLHGAYPGQARIPGNDPKFADVLRFLVQHGVAAPRYEIGFKAGSNQPDAVMIIWEGPVRDEQLPLKRDAHDVLSNPQLLVTALVGQFGLPLPRYPGYELRHPTAITPVGPVWPGHPHATELKLYHHPSAAAIENFKVGETHAEIRNSFDRPSQIGTVRRWRFDYAQIAPNNYAYCWIDESRPGELA